MELCEIRCLCEVNERSAMDEEAEAGCRAKTKMSGTIGLYPLSEWSEYAVIAKETGSQIRKEKFLIAEKNAFNAREIKSIEQSKKKI